MDTKILVRDSISIRAPARGATRCGNCNFRGFGNFNPRSREGSDTSAFAVACKLSNFNPRSREGSDLKAVTRLLPSVLFQSALPRGERRFKIHSQIPFKQYFNPRSREGSDPCPWVVLFVRKINFNPRSREGSDIDVLLSNASVQQISIRAPARGATRNPGGCLSSGSWISIRAPARGATEETRAERMAYYISIRAPARGATSIFAKKFSSLLAKIV